MTDAQTEPTFSRTLVIKNRKGLHARASAKLVQTAARFKAEVTVARDGTKVADGPPAEVLR